MPLKRILANAMKSKDTELQEEYMDFLKVAQMKNPPSFYQWKQKYHPDLMEEEKPLKRKNNKDEEEVRTKRTNQVRNQLRNALDESDLNRYGL